jgi:hypothetical protein
MTKQDIASIIGRQLARHGYHVTDAEASDVAAQIAQVLVCERDPLWQLFDSITNTPSTSANLHDYDGHIIAALREWAAERGLVVSTKTLNLPDRVWDVYKVGEIAVHDGATQRPNPPVSVDGEWSPAHLAVSP